MNESKEERSDAEDIPDRSPETEIDENGGESLLASKAHPKNEEGASTPKLTADVETADTDQGLETPDKVQTDDAEPGKTEKTELDAADDQIEHDETEIAATIDTLEDWFENEHPEDAENVNNNKKRKYIPIAILLGLIVAICSFLWFMNDWNWRFSGGPSPSQQAKQTDTNRRSKAIDASFSSQKTKQPETTGQVEISEHPTSGLADKLERATGLRNEFLKKQEEIRALKHYYRNKIQEVRDEILNEKRERGITTFQQALESKRIELGLRTIRRRHLYINKLNRPLEQLHGGSEELLYIERLAGIQIQMAPIVNGIDIVKLGKRMDIIIEKRASGIDSLAMDTRETRAPALEEIWKEIVQEDNVRRKPEEEGQKGENPEKEKSHSQRQDKINMGIWKEICAGNLSRKYELTKLSLNAAKCLSQWEGKDLFLNGITELPASIAVQLSQWGGEWLSLNCLTELSPEAAESLSRWQGIRLSLNGLIELTPQAAKHLFQWRGKQIEVVGLAKISPEADKYLTAWQEAGGKIFIRTLP